MKSKFSFLYVNAQFDVPKCTFISEKNCSKLVVFSLVFLADTKIIVGYSIKSSFKKQETMNNAKISRNYLFCLFCW